ncbi:hypothetical protein [Nocardia spumae]|uniref:hypothetical protein n=1 Tax=Nocardia spumae TaxID=2887190 RepID=UPI001D13A811|nr:hypothetical protein [Nocardia spumae]
MATTPELRAALAVLRADTDAAADQAGISDMSGTDTAGVEHALLAGLLYRLMGDDVRRSLTGAPDLTALEERARAAGPGTAKYASDDRDQREEHCAQAHFEAYWLADRIAGLHFTTTPPAPALQAAAHAAEATRTLLRIHYDMVRGVHPEAGHAGWESVLDQLDRARTLARAVHTATPTASRFDPRPAAAPVQSTVADDDPVRNTECRTP